MEKDINLLELKKLIGKDKLKLLLKYLINQNKRNINKDKTI